MNSRQIQPEITAFISCSLRPEDRPFVEFIESILRYCNIKPMGTVGRHYVAPENLAQSIHDNIAKADMVVVVATARYRQNDIHNGGSTWGIPNMLHSEAGIAFGKGKPVVAFVEEGTDLAGLIPLVTQYIVLKKGWGPDLEMKWGQVASLLQNAYAKVVANRREEQSKQLGRLVVGAAAFVGVLSIFKDTSSKDEEDDEDNSEEE